MLARKRRARLLRKEDCGLASSPPEPRFGGGEEDECIGRSAASQDAEVAGSNPVSRKAVAQSPARDLVFARSPPCRSQPVVKMCATSLGEGRFETGGADIEAFPGWRLGDDIENLAA